MQEENQGGGGSTPIILHICDFNNRSQEYNNTFLVLTRMIKTRLGGVGEQPLPRPQGFVSNRILKPGFSCIIDLQ